MINFYDINGILPIAIDFGTMGTHLRKLLEQYQVAEAQRDYVLLTLSRTERKTHGFIGKRLTRFYKGIPLALEISKDEKGEIKNIFFSAPFFMDFLALRMVLIPLFKVKLIESGGFPIFGSVFNYRQKTFLVLGEPGTGKTLLNLQALERGSLFIADNELMISHNKQIIGLFDEIELRYRTVVNTKYWHNLPLKTKMRLLIYDIISIVTFRYVSFNISPYPSELGIIKKNGSTGAPLIVIYLSKDMQHPSQTDAKKVIDLIIDYELKYRSIFGDFIFDVKKYEQVLREIMDTFFADSLIRSFPSNYNIDDILSMAEEQD